MGHLVFTSSSSILFTGLGLLTLNPLAVWALMRTSREIADIDIFIVVCTFEQMTEAEVLSQ